MSRVHSELMSVEKETDEQETDEKKSVKKKTDTVTGERAEASPESVKKGWRQSVSENAKLVAIALVIAIVVRFFIAEPRFIPSPSMVPTLAVGDRLLVEKVSYHLHPPHQGDIVVFEPPPQLQEYGYRASQAFIKRVIGLPGQQVKVTQGKVYVNGKPLNENYILEAPQYEMPLIQVPDNSLFVMGDNRNDSNDSHVWGFLPTENLIGRALLRFWPLNKVGKIDTSDL